MSKADYTTILAALEYYHRAGIIPDERYQNAITALDSAVECENIYEGLCK